MFFSRIEAGAQDRINVRVFLATETPPRAQKEKPGCLAGLCALRFNLTETLDRSASPGVDKQFHFLSLGDDHDTIHFPELISIDDFQ